MDTMRRVTIKDVCRHAKVSLSTASRVINDQPGVRDPIRRRVLDVIEKIGFSPHASARNLSSHRTRSNLVGVLVPFIEEPFFASFLGSIEQLLRFQSFYTLPVVSRVNPFDEAMKLIHERRVDGIVMFHPFLTPEQAQALRSQPVPVVVMNRYDSSFKLNTVVFDSYRGAYDATKHLIDHGYDRIATLTGWKDIDSDFRERLRGYKSALEDAGLPYDEQLVIETHENINKALPSFLDRFRVVPWPQAVFVQTDMLALELLDYVRNHRDEKIRSTAIVSFDDTPLARHVGLTSVRVFIEEYARMGGLRLMELMSAANLGAPAPAPREDVKTPQLVIRSSCGCVSGFPSRQAGAKESS
jgi:LacI family transcriptional regulator